MRISNIVFCHKEIGNCAKLKDFEKIWSLINSLTSKNNKSTNITEILVNGNSIVDSKSIAETFKTFENYSPISMVPIIRKVFEKDVFGQPYLYLSNIGL